MQIKDYSGNNRKLLEKKKVQHTRETAFSEPTVIRASFTSSIRALLLYAASLPPFNKRPLADAMAKAATCGSESGLDSNITNKTPMGTVT